MSDERMAVAEAFASHWRGMYGDEGLLLVNAGTNPTEEQLEALSAAVAPITKEPITAAVLVNNGVPTFTTPQRRYQKIEPTGMLPDPASATQYHGEHTQASITKVGAWRWKIVAKHRDIILPLIQGRRTMDFGGLAGPIGYGSIIVDHGSDEYRAPYDLQGPVDAIFTSHTLEHIRDIPGALECLGRKLTAGGWLIVVVPSWRFEFLRAENYPHHHHTFCLRSDHETYEPIDTAISAYADCAVHLADDDGESILVIARKR